MAGHVESYLKENTQGSHINSITAILLVAVKRIELRKPMLWWVCDPDVPCSLPVRTRKQRRLSRHENGQRARLSHRQLVGATKSSGLGLAQPVGNSSSYSPPQLATGFAGLGGLNPEGLM